MVQKSLAIFLDHIEHTLARDSGEVSPFDLNSSSQICFNFSVFVLTYCAHFCVILKLNFRFVHFKRGWSQNF
jgi:hypothetical protein